MLQHIILEYTLRLRVSNQTRAHHKIMSKAQICLCTLTIHLPGLTSLKQKRGILKSLIAKTQNKFNVSIAEVAENDKWQLAQLAIVIVSNSTSHNQSAMDKIVNFIEDSFSDIIITHQDIEMI